MNQAQDWSVIELLEPRAEMSATLLADNVTPVAAIDSATLRNDTGTELTIAKVTQGMHGSVKLNPDNTVTYSPVGMFIGSDSFTYTIINSARETAIGRVTVMVSAPNRASATTATSKQQRVCSSHADTTTWPTFDLAAAAKETGKLNFRLAFIVAELTDEPCRNGHCTINAGFVVNPSTSLRSIGGEVSISFGGTSGVDFADAMKSAPELDAA